MSEFTTFQEAVNHLNDSTVTAERLRSFLLNSEVGTRAGEQWTNDVMNILTSDEADLYDKFNKIRDITVQYLPESGVFSEQRWNERAQNRARVIVGTLPSDFSPTSILDVGCSEGSITTALKEYYEIPAERVHGIDVRCDTRLQEPDFTFTKIEPGQTLPFEDGYFDLITASMVLHHVIDSNDAVLQLLEELYRVMKPGGYIVVTEHDVGTELSADVAAFLNLVHAFYDIVLSNPQSTTPQQFDEEYDAVYRSAQDWSALLLDSQYLLYNEFRPSGTNLMNRFVLVGHKTMEQNETVRALVVEPPVQLLEVWSDDQLYQQFLDYIRAHPLSRFNKNLESELVTFINSTGSNTADDYQLYEAIRQLITTNIRGIRDRYTNQYLRTITSNTRGINRNNSAVIYSAFADRSAIESVYNDQNPGDYLIVFSANAAISMFDYYILSPTNSERQMPTALDQIQVSADLLSSIGYVYTDITTSSPGGVSYSLYRKPPTASQEKTVKSVQQHYDSKRTVPLTESRVRYLRSFNNWVKTTLINRYVRPGDLVIDFAGGKGGDILKYMHAGASELLIVDLSPESIREAEQRVASIRNNKMIVRTLTADIGTDIVDDITGIIQDRDVAVVSIQFALHYLLDNWDRFYTVLDNMDALLKDGGYVIITVPDAALLNSRFSQDREFGNDLYRVQYLEDSTDDSPIKYSFYLEDSIDNLPEYIVETAEINKGVDELGWQLILDENFTDYYKSGDRTVEELELMKKLVNFRSDGTFPQDNWEVVQLYRVLVYQKTA